MSHWRVLVRIEWIYHIIHHYTTDSFSIRLVFGASLPGSSGQNHPGRRWDWASSGWKIFGLRPDEGDIHVIIVITHWGQLALVMSYSCHVHHVHGWIFKSSDVVTRHWQPQLHRQSDKACGCMWMQPSIGSGTIKGDLWITAYYCQGLPDTPLIPPYSL